MKKQLLFASNKWACPLVIQTLINNGLQPVVISTITIIFLLLTSVNLFGQFSGGSGTSADPYKIASKIDMKDLADSVNNGNNWSRGRYFKLMNDITDSVRTYIGTDTLAHSFQGEFDGNGKSITIALDYPDREFIGTFSYATDAIVKNLSVNGYIKAAGFIGGIVGYGRNVDFTGCNNYTDISGTGNSIGGIAGFNEGRFFACNNYGKIVSSGDYSPYTHGC